MGHTEIYAWGERVRHIGYGLYAVLREPRIPLPLGMESVKCAANGDSHQEFRTKCLEKFVEYNALDYMYDNVKEQSLRWYKGDESHGSDFYQPE